MRQLILLFIIFALFGDFILAAPKFKRFPSIRRASISIETSPSKLEESSELVIETSHGEPAYVLSIVAISLDHRTTHDVELSITTTGNYSSDPEGRYEPNLFNPDYWGHGVGREVIRPEEICQVNQHNPIVGARREFTFRRMRIVAKIENAELNPNFCSEKECGNQIGGFTKLRLTVTVEPSASMRRRPAGYDELGWKYLELRKCR